MGSFDRVDILHAAAHRSSKKVAIAIIGLASFFAVLFVFYAYGLAGAADAWSREEYGHGYFVPLIALFLLWHKLPDAISVVPDHRWVGPLIAVPAVFLGLIGSVGRIADLSGYGFILAVVAGCISTLGLRATVLLWVPLAYLVFMLPLPQVVYLQLSAEMQIASSELGVAFVRLIGIPVLLEGNIIDLGSYRLQVAEACSGLRYLFPLMSFGFLFAVLFRGPGWQKWTLFLSTIPITIVMNSVRIAVIAVLVNLYGTGMAEGVLHFFQGWIVFLCCTALLFAEAAVLWRLTGRRGAFRDAFEIVPPALPPKAAVLARFSRPTALVFTVALMVLGLLVLTGQRVNDPVAVPAHRALSEFPSNVDGWRGIQKRLPVETLQVLDADDQLYAVFDHHAHPEEMIDLFIAYYNDQRDGRAVHSPQVCLPGSGWEVRNFAAVDKSVPGRATGFRVNRAIIQKGLSQALVYYWFEGRGRTATGAYEAKWYILRDALTRNRTDGALVRLVTMVSPRGGEAAADVRLTNFLSRIKPQLSAYVPD